MLNRYYAVVDTGKRRRRVFAGKDGSPRWHSSKKTRGTFTSVMVQKKLIPWARKKGYTVTLRPVKPFPHLVVDSDTTLPTRELSRKLERVARRLNRKLFIREGLRTRARQQELYDQGVAIHGYPNVLNYVARPGTSRHETGVAADVGVITSTGGVLGVNLGQYPGALAAIEAEGLNLPMSWEPWHVEL